MILDTILEIAILVVIIVATIIILVKILHNNNTTNNADLEKQVKNIKEDILHDNSTLKMEMDNKLSLMKTDILNNLTTYLDTFKESINEKLDDLSKTLKENLSNVSNNVKENTSSVEKYLDSIRTTLNESLDKLRAENSEKLEKMQKTVDEKLDETLNNRLTESFKLVQGNLSKVEESLGEMKSLASGVGDLKKVLTNVKTKGIWGEMQLSQILSNILTPEQYAENIVTKKGSKDPVEFAVKLPGDNDQIVYLPIDSKFPLEVYNNLVIALESTDKDAIDKAYAALKTQIKKNAKDIHDKYIAPPETTDFGIMFLPTEGLYAEVARLGLIETLQQDYHIMISGPTTLSALLNSLQVGFRTLAIEKRSSEVWTLLSAVKTEFGNFQGVLEKASKKLDEAHNEIETLVGVRTRKINSKLKSVQELDYNDSKEVLDIEIEEE